jgi:hypothetical protein
VNILEAGFRKIVEVHEAVRKPEVSQGIEDHLVLSITRHVLDGETNFLKRDVSMFVRAEHFGIGLLECAKETSSSGRLIVVTQTVIVMIPGRRIFQEFSRALQNPQIRLAHTLLSRFQPELPN